MRRDLWRLGGHQGHGIPQVAHLVVAQHGPVVQDQPVPVPSGHVRVGQHSAHPGQRRGLAGVDRPDPGVREGSAQRRPIEHAGKGIVIRIAGRAGHLVHRIGPGRRVPDRTQWIHHFHLDRRQRISGPVRLQGRPDRPDHAGIPGAAAGVAPESALDLVVADRLRSGGPFVPQRRGRH